LIVPHDPAWAKAFASEAELADRADCQQAKEPFLTLLEAEAAIWAAGR